MSILMCSKRRDKSNVNNFTAQSVCFWNFSGLHFPAFRLNIERYSASLRIQSECEKMRTRKTPNADTFYAVSITSKKCE